MAQRSAFTTLEFDRFKSAIIGDEKWESSGSDGSVFSIGYLIGSYFSDIPDSEKTMIYNLLSSPEVTRSRSQFISDMARSFVEKADKQKQNNQKVQSDSRKQRQ